ncbi:MAG: restriction endonuclease subunit S [Chlorobium sp.]|nr:MAG: restriction endonuclease subunit S [Chlorobium sp.]
MKEGWEIKKLGALCEIELGKTPSRARKTFWDQTRKSNNVWLSISDLLRAEDNIVFDSKEYISDSGAKISKIVRKGTLLVSFKLTLGRLAFAGRDLYTNEAIAALTIVNECNLSKEFLFYFFHFFDWDKATEGDVKIKGKTLNKAKLKLIDVYFPPVAEQLRIVAILDGAFEGIATAKANAEKNLKNARQLFESHLNSVFSQRGEGWVEKSKPLDYLCELIVDCEHKTAPTQTEGIPSIRTPNIGKGKLLLDGVYRVSEQTYNEWTRRAVPRGSDLVIAREAPAGNVAVIPDNLRLCLGQRTVLVRPKADIFESEFLAFFLLQSEMQKKLLAHSRGATVQHVNMKDIRALEIVAIPTLQEQRSILSKIKSLERETQRLESIYQKKIEALDALRKSILQKAFSGKL